jgi:hypothetical protein
VSKREIRKKTSAFEAYTQSREEAVRNFMIGKEQLEEIEIKFKESKKSQVITLEALMSSNDIDKEGISVFGISKVVQDNLKKSSDFKAYESTIRQIQVDIEAELF